MITIPLLHDAICDFIEAEVAKRFNLKTVDIYGMESLKNPDVIRSGRLLPQSIDDDGSEEEAYPCIIPRTTRVKGVENARENVAEVLILFGVYDPGTYTDEGKRINDGSGFRDFWNLVEATRQALFTQHTLNNKFRIHDDYFDAGLIEEQIFPYWEGYCITKWDVAYPIPRLEESFF